MKEIADNHIRILEKAQFSCADTSELLGDFYEGDLPISLEARLKDHIKTCSYCRDFNKSYKGIINLAHELKEPKPSKHFDDDAQKRLRAALNERLGLNLRLISN